MGHLDPGTAQRDAGVSRVRSVGIERFCLGSLQRPYMNRKTIAGVFLLAGALIGGGTVAIATPSDPCAQYVNTSNNAVSGYENYRYLDCRMDRQDAALEDIRRQLTWPSASPSPSETLTATATPSASPSASDSPSASPTATATPSASQTPTASPSASETASETPSPSATPATFKGWQLTTTNIGLAPHGLTCAALPAYTGSLKPAAGATITEKRITGNLDLSNGGITIERSCIKPTSGDNRALASNDVCGANECVVPAGRAQVTIRDSEFDATAAPASSIAASCAFRGVGILQRNLMRGMGSGICFFGTGYQLDGLAENNYVLGLRSYGESHNEAATIRDFRLNSTSPAGRSVKFINNRLDCSSGNETGGLFIQPTWVDIANSLVQGNYFEGGGYNLFLNKAGGNYFQQRAIDNRFRPTGWGPSAVQGGTGWVEWRDNYRYDATKTDARGAVVNP